MSASVPQHPQGSRSLHPAVTHIPPHGPAHRAAPGAGGPKACHHVPCMLTPIRDLTAFLLPGSALCLHPGTGVRGPHGQGRTPGPGPGRPCVPTPLAETFPAGDTIHLGNTHVRVQNEQLGLGLFETGPQSRARREPGPEQQQRWLLASWPWEPPGAPREWGTTQTPDPCQAQATLSCVETLQWGTPRFPSMQEQLVAGGPHWQRCHPAVTPRSPMRAGAEPQMCTEGPCLQGWHPPP